MIEKIIQFSVNKKLVTGILLLVFVGIGIYSTTQLPIDALPDVTNNQVQVITNAPNLATQEVEQFITYPIEMQMKTIPDVVELRSTSRSGLSVITIVFKDKIPVNIARQAVSERLKIAEEELPKQFGSPEIIPPTTGLGEIYQYTIAPKKGFEKKYSAMELRTIQDWIVRRQLIGVAGIVDVSSFGGYLKQYEVAVAPEKLVSMNISLTDVFNALSKNNQNTGGSYIDKGPNIYFIRGEGLIENLQDIENIVVKNANGIPIKVHDIGTVQFGYAPRYGAMTRNGQGETVGGVVLMLKGANSVKVIADVKEKMKTIEKNLPEGLTLDVFVDRTKLIERTIGTVSTNLIEGALIVIFVLVLLLGNLRAGLIVASVIPLAMLFAVMMMNIFGVSANLMSMGALDFGLIVDGAVIVVESMLHIFSKNYKNNTLSQNQMDTEVIGSSSKIMSSAVFGQVIILIVYVPIFALTGIEGKMFLPMAQTVSFAIVGALLLSLTYVPLMSSLFLNKTITHKESWSDKFIRWANNRYTPLLKRLLNHRIKVVSASIIILIATIFLFNSLGGEFIPEMDEGDFATNYTIRQGSNLSQTIKTGTQLENILLKNFPEVVEVVSKIGTSEVPTDPMPIESADLIIVLKDKKEWTSAHSSEELAEKMNEKMSAIPGVNLSFEQPIQMRFNELIAGVKSDVAIKIFGEDLDMLFQKGNEVSKIISGIDGLTDIKVEQVTGMPQLVVKYNRARIAQYGLNIEDVNAILNTALAGGKAGVVYEGEKKFDLVVRLANYRDADEEKVKNIFVPLPNGTQIPLSQIAEISFQSAPAQISRDDAERRIVVEANVRGRDIQSVVEETQKKLDAELKLPSGYFITYGGTFQNLQEAKDRLLVAVPVALLLIFLLLFFSFRSITESLIIFSAIPLAAIGGVVAIWLRGMNFSISAGVGFIALFGVAVLNGIVLIAYFNRLRDEGEGDVTQRILKGTAARLRPVLATAAVASLGFLPMALSTSAGSEVQKPLATVVIGGLISSTLLTLIVLPVLYSLFIHRKSIGNRQSAIGKGMIGLFVLLIANCLLPIYSSAQTVSLDSCIAQSLRNHPMMEAGKYSIQQQQQLKKTAFTFDPLNVLYTGGQINSSVNDYNVAVTSGIKFPTEIAAQTKYQNAQIALAQTKLNVTKAELIKNVSLGYMQLQNGMQQFQLLNSLDSIYTNFAKNADTKYKVGETGLLEKLAAETQMKQLQLRKQEAEANLLSFQSELQQWVGTTQPISISANAITTLPPPPLLDNTALQNNPLLQFQKQQLNVSVSAFKLEKNKYAPSLQFGYFNQSLDLVKNFQGFSIGTSIPIFKTGQQGRINAAKLQTEIAQKELESFQLSLNTAYTQAVQQFNKYNQSLNYYNSEGLTLAQTLFSTANKSYQSGDIGYVEYIQNISNAFDIRNNYLLTLNNYNQSIININYLLNK
ncbi:MAG: CusA/CzcA family heavy metal efflux RND transporter [Bacteroidia bacterium]